MNQLALKISDLLVKVGGKVILNGGELTIYRGEIGAIVGANGSGKTSLARVLIGDPQLSIERGRVELDGRDILDMDASERMRMGLFSVWQNPISISGVKIFSLAKAMRLARGKQDNLIKLKLNLEKLSEKVGLTREHIGRSVNEGFSGGEKKRLELMWLLLSEAKVAILDEVDSGLDEEGRELVVRIVKKLQKEGVAIIVITHYPKMLEKLKVRKIWTIHNGRLQAGS